MWRTYLQLSSNNYDSQSKVSCYQPKTAGLARDRPIRAKPGSPASVRDTDPVILHQHHPAFCLKNVWNRPQTANSVHRLTVLPADGYIRDGGPTHGGGGLGIQTAQTGQPGQGSFVSQTAVHRSNVHRLPFSRPNRTQLLSIHSRMPWTMHNISG